MRARQGRSFFLTPGGEWLEVGAETAGDRSDTVVTLGAAPIFYRRAATDLETIVAGLVPWPSFARHLFVYPGRNVLSGPFTSADRLGVWHSGISNTFKTADSAARADTLRIGYFDGTESPVVYLDSSLTWRAVGQKGNAGDTRMGLIMAIDLQRAGPAGFVGMNGIDPGPQPMALALPVAEQAINESRRVGNGIEISWTGEPDQRYQVRVRRMTGGAWKDSGEPVEADGGRCAAQLGLLEGSGLIRVIESR